MFLIGSARRSLSFCLGHIMKFFRLTFKKSAHFNSLNNECWLHLHKQNLFRFLSDFCFKWTTDLLRCNSYTTQFTHLKSIFYLDICVFLYSYYSHDLSFPLELKFSVAKIRSLSHGLPCGNVASWADLPCSVTRAPWLTLLSPSLALQIKGT